MYHISWHVPHIHVYLWVMIRKRNFTLQSTPKLRFHYQKQCCVIPKTPVFSGGVLLNRLRQYTTGWPRLNHSGSSDRLVVSLISGQGYFTLPYGHTKHNIHNREGGRKEQTWILVSSKRKKGEVCDTFLAFCELSQACIRAKLLAESPGMLTHLLTLANQASGSTGLDPALFCWLPCSVDQSWLPPSQSSLGPSFLRLLVGDLARKPFVWVLRQNRQRDVLIGHTHTHTTNAHIMSQVIQSAYSKSHL